MVGILAWTFHRGPVFSVDSQNIYHLSVSCSRYYIHYKRLPQIQ